MLEESEEELLDAPDPLDHLHQTPALPVGWVVGQQLEDQPLAVEVHEPRGEQQPPTPADVHLLARVQVYAAVDPLADL